MKMVNGICGEKINIFLPCKDENGLSKYSSERGYCLSSFTANINYFSDINIRCDKCICKVLKIVIGDDDMCYSYDKALRKRQTICYYCKEFEKCVNLNNKLCCRNCCISKCDNIKDLAYTTSYFKIT
jgi:hypothetical protein